jgi:dTDP-4-dehydrorhamnose 3,5-epimerase
MKSNPLNISGAFLIEETRFEDSRGWFQQWHQSSTLEEACGFSFPIRQSNISHSRAGSIRGIHYSLCEEGQAKFVFVMRGKIEDFIVDIRIGSPTFGQYEKITLDDTHPTSLIIGPGLGHAFQALEENTVVSYLLSSEYSPSSEFAINPFCPELSLEWSKEFDHLVSEKDSSAPSLVDQRLNGRLPFWKN